MNAGFFPTEKKYLLRIVVFCFFLISFLLRFWQLPQWLYFMMDEERDAFIVKRILIDKRPVLIGGAVPGGIYLGPGFYYLSSLVMLFSKLNPLGEGIIASFLGFASIIILYFTAEILFNKKIALFSTIFYSFSFLTVIYNRIWWPLVLSPLLSLGVYFFLFKIIKPSKQNQEKKLRLVLPLGLLLILGVQSDPASFALLLLVVLFWFIFRLPLKKKPVLQALGLFCLAHISVIFFDLRHDFLNVRALLRLFSFSSANGGINLSASLKGIFMISKVLARILFISGPPDLIKQISPCDQYLFLKDEIPFWLLFLSTIILLTFLFNFLKLRKKNMGLFIVGSHLLVILAGIFLYNLFFPGYTHEWFFYTFFPGFCLILGWFFSFIFEKESLKPVVFLLIIFFVLVNLKSFNQGKNSFNFKDKSQAVKYAIEKTGYQDFYLDSLGSCFGYGGYRYLFWFYGKEPIKSHMDYVYADWLYPKNDREKPNLGVVMVNPADQENEEFYQSYDFYKNKAIEQKKFGQVEVLLVQDD